MPATTQRVFAGAREKVPEGGRLVIDVGETTIGVFRVGKTLRVPEQVRASGRAGVPGKDDPAGDRGD